MRTPIAILALACLLGVAPAQAQRTDAALALRVLAHETGLPLAGVQVWIPARGLGGRTDEAGRVRIEGIPAGSHVVEVRRLGYATEQLVVGFAPGEQVEGEVELLLDPVVLEEVEATARGSEASETRAQGVRRDLITREEIAAAGPGKRHVGDLLQGRVPGLRIFEAYMKDESEMSGPGAGASRRLCIQMNRALQQIDRRRQCSMVAVYVDGVRVADPGTYLLGLSLETLESVELLGPIAAGARYGTDSGYGVLEIHTRGGRRP